MTTTFFFNKYSDHLNCSHRHNPDAIFNTNSYNLSNLFDSILNHNLFQIRTPRAGARKAPKLRIHSYNRHRYSYSSTHPPVNYYHRATLPSRRRRISHNVMHSKLNIIDIVSNIRITQTHFVVIDLFVHFVILLLFIYFPSECLTKMLLHWSYHQRKIIVEGLAHNFLIVNFLRTFFKYYNINYKFHYYFNI